jgi:hypothetical protein
MKGGKGSVIEWWHHPPQRCPNDNIQPWRVDQYCRNPTLAKCGGEAQHLEKVRIWSPPGLPNVQSSTTRPKTPRIEMFLVSLERSWSVNVENGLALAIWTSVAQVMSERRGRESNCQFDSRPLKVENRPLPDLRIESAIRGWKDLDAGYKFCLDFVAIRRRGRELWAPKRPETPPGTISGLQPGSLGKKWHSGVGAAESRRVYYREYGGGILPRSGPWCVSWSKVPVACPNTQRCPGMWTNHVGGLFWCRFKLDLLVPRPSLISGLPTRPSTPF